MTGGKTDEVKGRVKEAAGALTGDKDLKRKGKADQSAAKLKQDAYVSKLFDVLGPRYKDRQGGYVRVLKAGFRYGDMAPMAIIEFVDRDRDAKGAADKARVAAAEEAQGRGG